MGNWVRVDRLVTQCGDRLRTVGICGSGWEKGDWLGGVLECRERDEVNTSRGCRAGSEGVGHGIYHGQNVVC